MFTMNLVEGEAVTVRHPSRVDVVVLTRSDAEDLVASGPNRGVAACAAVHVDGWSFLEEPDAHLEAEVVAGKRSDGADINGVEAVVVI